jgi:AcrR family transcriptional regulator
MNNNEQLILEAAEVEFLEKGFKNAATTAIAKRAGVTHAMLHYYYRTKENLFKKVFQEKVQVVSSMFDVVFHENVPFQDVIRSFVEKHFDFIVQNPQLMSFVYNEITTNPESRKLVLEVLAPKVKHVLNHLEKLINEQAEKGFARPVKVVDLMMNIASMNLISLMALPVMKDLTRNQSDEYFDNLLNERKESNVQFILNALKV